jgi:hypothetical protein
MGRQRRSNGRLEHLRGSALGFRNLTNYIARSLLQTGGFRLDSLSGKSMHSANIKIRVYPPRSDLLQAST